VAPTLKPFAVAANVGLGGQLDEEIDLAPIRAAARERETARRSTPRQARRTRWPESFPAAEIVATLPPARR
jgi:hypothetical protein